MQNMPRVARDSFVRIVYTLCSEDGELLEQVEANDPLDYVHGYGQLVPGLEQALEGLSGGEERAIVVPPEEGYGAYDPEGLVELDRSGFPHPERLTPGEQYLAESESGETLSLTVMEVGEESVKVDLNHPLAGEKLHYKVKVIDVRPATADELAAAQEGRDHPERCCCGCDCEDEAEDCDCDCEDKAGHCGCCCEDEEKAGEAACEACSGAPTLDGKQK